LFHLVAYACVKMLHARPGLNRFVCLVAASTSARQCGFPLPLRHASLTKRH
jgi:hypothetical protein